MTAIESVGTFQTHSNVHWLYCGFQHDPPVQICVRRTSTRWPSGQRGAYDRPVGSVGTGTRRRCWRRRRWPPGDWDNWSNSEGGASGKESSQGAVGEDSIPSWSWAWEAFVSRRHNGSFAEQLCRFRLEDMVVGGIVVVLFSVNGLERLSINAVRKLGYHSMVYCCDMPLRHMS